MKTKLKNIALEGTRSGDFVGGLLLWAEVNLQALFFVERGLNIDKGDSKKTGCPKGG